MDYDYLDKSFRFSFTNANLEYILILLFKVLLCWKSSFARYLSRNLSVNAPTPSLMYTPTPAFLLSVKLFCDYNKNFI